VKGDRIFWLAIAALTVAMAAIIYNADATQPAPFQVHITVHDAFGRSMQVVGNGNTLIYDNAVLTLDYSGDQYFCSGFEP
jgi:hypothetical protein